MSRFCIALLLLTGCGALLGLNEAELAVDATPADGPAGSMDATDGPPAYHATAVHFDGNTYLTANMLSNVTSSPRGTLSMWLHFNGGDAAAQSLVIAQVVGVGGLTRTAANRIQVVLPNCSGVTLLDMTTVGTYTSASGWIELLASWDVSAGKAQLYINDVPDLGANPGISNGNICYIAPKWGIGGLSSGQLQADVADLYAALGTFIDLDVVANRRMFRTADGKPVDLGPDCTTPTGALPTGCFTGKLLGWNTNKGNGGGFTVAGDALTAALTSPSD